MAGRQTRMHTAKITINGVEVTITADTPEGLGQKIVAIQGAGTTHRPTTSRARLLSDLRPATRTHQDYQATPRVPFEEQICRYGVDCTKQGKGCTRKHIPAEERSRTNSSSSSSEADAKPTKPTGFCKFGKDCKNKDTTCKFRHDKECTVFKGTGACPYGDKCKYMH